MFSLFGGYSLSKFGSAAFSGIFSATLCIVSPDHLGPILSLALTEVSSFSSAFRLGYHWGLGHSSGILVILLLMRLGRETSVHVSTRVAEFFHFLVGAGFVLLGIRHWRQRKIRLEAMARAMRETQELEESGVMESTGSQSTLLRNKVSLDLACDCCEPSRPSKSSRKFNLMTQFSNKDDGHDLECEEAPSSSSSISVRTRPRSDESLTNFEEKERKNSDSKKALCFQRFFLVFRGFRCFSFCLKAQMPVFHPSRIRDFFLGFLQGLSCPSNLLSLLVSTKQMAVAEECVYLLSYFGSTCIFMGIFCFTVKRVLGASSYAGGRGMRIGYLLSCCMLLCVGGAILLEPVLPEWATVHHHAPHKNHAHHQLHKERSVVAPNVPTEIATSSDIDYGGFRDTNLRVSDSVAINSKFLRRLPQMETEIQLL